MLQQKLESGGTTRYDLRVRNLEGEWLHWEINSGLTHDATGKPVELHVVGRDVTERKRSEERQTLLINELNHRVKNTLAVIQSITHQTLSDGRTDHAVRDALESRIAALSAAHDVLTRESWSSASMREIIVRALQPFCSMDRCELSGPDVRLGPRTAVTMALAVHELATNATKYGALSAAAGRLSISWSIQDDEFSFRWREQGGPPVLLPTRRGFGSRILERALATELGARAEMIFLPEGLNFSLQGKVPQLD
jgi:two-component sensor histidine kinase